MSDMKVQEIDCLVNRLNYDAIIFKGCSANELVMTALFSAAISCLICGVWMQAWIGNFIIGMAAGFIISIGLTFVLIFLLERIKKGHADGYLGQLLRMKLDNQGWMKSGLIRRTGKWVIGRYLR